MSHNTLTLNPLPEIAVSAIEAALAAAYEIHGDEAVQSAEQDEKSASDRLAVQEAELATSGRVTELRGMLLVKHQALHQHHYLKALAAGEQPEALPATPDVAGDLVVRYARVRPGAFAELIGSCEARATAADAQGAASGSRLEMLRDEYRAGRLDLARFTEAFSRELTEQAEHQAKATRYRAAAETARSSLASNIGEALGSLPDLKTGLRECLSLVRQTDPVVTQFTAELDAVNGDLVRLGAWPR